MDWEVVKLFFAFSPISFALLIPLIRIRKSSKFYFWVWAGYGVTVLSIIIPVVYQISNSTPKEPDGYVSMSPIGDVTAWGLVVVAAFLVAVPIFLYLITIGLPWILRNRDDVR